MNKKWAFILSIFMIFSLSTAGVQLAQASDVKAHSEGGINLRIKGGGKPTKPTEPIDPTDPITKPEGGKPLGKIPQLGDVVKGGLSIFGGLLLLLILLIGYRRKKNT